MTSAWHILTGEYPPQPGGVSDYTRLVAQGLADRGIDVHVWASPTAAGSREESFLGATVHRDAGHWRRSDLARLGTMLDRFPSPRNILVQYAPNAFHPKGLNFGLPTWLSGRRAAGDSIRVMFHETTYIVKSGDRLMRRLLAMGQRRIVAGLLRSAETVDVAIPYWERLIRPLDRDRRRVYGCRPVPSNVPIVDDPEGVAAIRRDWASRGVSTLLGSFGTFAGDVEAMLAAIAIPALQTSRDRGMILIGRGGDRAAARWLQACPELAGRIEATGSCSPDVVSRQLQAADLLLQPYPGGVCGKRGSLMASLAHARPTLTTSGEVTEPFWTETGSVALASEHDLSTAISLAESLLDDPDARAQTARAGRALYDSTFDLRHTLDSLVRQ
jgi:hypothetical protein